MWKFSRKNTLENFRNFPEKYEIFRTIFPPHNTIWNPSVQTLTSLNTVLPFFVYFFVYCTIFFRGAEGKHTQAIMVYCHYCKLVLFSFLLAQHTHDVGDFVESRLVFNAQAATCWSKKVNHCQIIDKSYQNPSVELYFSSIKSTVK